MSSAGPRYFALLTSIACLIAVGACGLVVGDLPEAKKQGSGGDGGSAGAGTGGAAGETGGVGGESGTAGTGGAGGAGGSGPCSADDGDADGDGVKRSACGGGLDCDDGNGDVFPGQADWFDAPRDNSSFDYNCDGSEQQQHEFSVACPAIGLGCETGREGFLNVLPACGTPGKWGTCTKGTLNCVENVSVSDKQMTCR